jgi:hypothetical protein
MMADEDYSRKTPEQQANLVAQEEASIFDRVRGRVEERVESLRARYDEIEARLTERQASAESAIQGLQRQIDELRAERAEGHLAAKAEPEAKPEDKPADKKHGRGKDPESV